jgi:hypothetical protein
MQVGTIDWSWLLHRGKQAGRPSLMQLSALRLGDNHKTQHSVDRVWSGTSERRYADDCFTGADAAFFAAVPGAELLTALGTLMRSVLRIQVSRKPLSPLSDVS